MISGALFFAADMFAIASLSMPNWIVSNVGGEWKKDNPKAVASVQF